MRKTSRWMVSAVLMSLMGCADDSEPAATRCNNGSPGISVAMDFRETAGLPADFYITYASGVSQSLLDALPAPPWSGTIDVVADYGTMAVDGDATIGFSGRPDPGVDGQVQVIVNRQACTEASMVLTLQTIDAGI